MSFVNFFLEKRRRHSGVTSTHQNHQVVLLLEPPTIVYAARRLSGLRIKVFPREHYFPRNTLRRVSSEVSSG